MRLQALLEGVDVISVVGERDVDVTSVTHDSRRVEPGTLFACVPGERFDGHDFAGAAVSAGAVALLVERPLGLGATEAMVASTRVAIGPVAAAFFGAPSRAMRCLGVTGTNGKTTTTYLLEAIARAAGEHVGVIGTTGARLDGQAVPIAHTTPEAPDLQALLAWMRDATATRVAMEVSSHALAQHRVDGTRFAAVCFTNLSHDHLDYHGDLEAYFASKARLFSAAFADAAALNLDDAHGCILVERAHAAGLRTVTYGIDRVDADVSATDVTLTRDGSRFTLHDRLGGRSAPLETSLRGRFNVANALAAAATASADDVPFDAIVAGLCAPVVVPGRLEPVVVGQPFTVLVDYAHTPDALAAALAASRAMADGNRVVVVFGCGGDRDREKRGAMGRVAALGADRVLVTSDNPRSEDPAAIADEIVAGTEGARGEVSVDLDRRRAIREALRAARPGDVVLVAGKGHEATQTTGATAAPFDDRIVAREELGSISWS